MHKLYTRSHEWIMHNDGQITIGITDYGQDCLGEIVFIELPQVGQKMSKGETLCVVESVKAASEISSPLSGIVKTVNSALLDTPQLINKSAEDMGWICILDGDIAHSEGVFLDIAEYQKLIELQ